MGGVGHKHSIHSNMEPFKGPPAWDLATCTHYLAVGTDLTEPGYFKQSNEKVLSADRKGENTCLRWEKQHEPIKANKLYVLAPAARAKFN